MRDKIKMMMVLLLGGFITSFSETLLNNALPIIMEELHISQMTAQWLSTGYLLTAGITMPIAAYFTNRFKLKPLFISVMSIFLIGTLIAVQAPNFLILLFGRIIQAVSVGISMPLIQNVIALIFPPEKRGLALGISGIVISLGPALGPTLSGYIVDHYSWRMLFIILIPIVSLTIIFSFFEIKNVTSPQKMSIDILSVIYSSIGLGALLYSFSSLEEASENGGIVLSTFLVGIGMTGVFILRQFKLQVPLLQLRVFKAKSFRKVAILAALSAIAMMGPELIIPLYNQEVRGLSAMVSGLLLLPGALMMAFLSPISGRLYDLFGIKKLAYVGYGLAVISTIPMLWFNTTTNIYLIMLTYLIRVSGITLVYMQVNVNGLNALPKEYVVDGSTVIITIQQIASSLGTALMVAITSVISNLIMLKSLILRVFQSIHKKPTHKITHNQKLIKFANLSIVSF